MRLLCEFAIHIIYVLINVCTVYFEFSSLQYRVKVEAKKSWVKRKNKRGGGQRHGATVCFRGGDMKACLKAPAAPFRGIGNWKPKV